MPKPLPKPAPNGLPKPPPGGPGLVVSCQLTEKALPASERELGCAWSSVRSPPPKCPKRSPPYCSVTGSDVQAELPIEPLVMPLAVVASLNRTCPKSVSRCWLQSFAEPQSAGASAIHSAEVVSGSAIVSVLVKRVPWLTFRTISVTSRRCTLTVASSVSPGVTLNDKR